MGTPIPPLRRDIDLATLVRYAGASGDFNPIHFDDTYARAAGLERVIGHGMLAMALVSEAVTDWVGDSSLLRELSVRFTGSYFLGDRLTVRGEVARREVDADGHMRASSCDLRCVDRGRTRDHRPGVGDSGVVAGVPSRHARGGLIAMLDLESMRAREEIRDVLYRYCRATDRRDWETLRACYHDDAYDDHGSLVGPIDEFIRISKPFADRVAATMHFMGNVLIELDGDVARVESYVIAYHVIEADDGTSKHDNWGIRYVDRFERRDGELADRPPRRGPRAAQHARRPRGPGPALDAGILGLARRDRPAPLDPRRPPAGELTRVGRAHMSADRALSPDPWCRDGDRDVSVGGAEYLGRGGCGGTRLSTRAVTRKGQRPCSQHSSDVVGERASPSSPPRRLPCSARCGDDSDGASADASTAGSTDESSATSTASSDDAASDEPFRVLFIGPLSGPLAVVGNSEVAGFEAAIDLVNADGGILGHPVELTALDDAGDGTTAISLLEEELASGTEYHLISAGAGAYDAVALAPALADVPVLQIPMAGEQVLNDPDTYPNLYVPSGGFGPQTLGIMERLEEDGISNVAVMFGENVPEGAERLEEAADEVGIEVSASVGVPAAATDAIPQLQQAMDSDPEAIAISGFSPALVPILKARSTLGLDIPVYLDPFAGAANLGPSTTAEDRCRRDRRDLPLPRRRRSRPGRRGLAGLRGRRRRVPPRAAALPVRAAHRLGRRDDGQGLRRGRRDHLRPRGRRRPRADRQRRGHPGVRRW